MKKTVKRATKDEKDDINKKCSEVWEKILADLLQSGNLLEAKWILHNKLNRTLEIKDLMNVISTKEEVPDYLRDELVSVLTRLDKIDDSYLRILAKAISVGEMYWGNLPELLLKFNPDTTIIGLIIDNCVKYWHNDPHKIEVLIKNQSNFSDDKTRSWLYESLRNGNHKLAEKLAQVFYNRSLGEEEALIFLNTGIERGDMRIFNKALDLLDREADTKEYTSFLKNWFANKKDKFSIDFEEIIKLAKSDKNNDFGRVEPLFWKEIASEMIDRGNVCIHFALLCNIINV